MGPFSGINTEYILKKGIYTRRLIIEQSADIILKAIANCGVLSKHQATLITGCKNVPNTIRRLASKGYLDEYISKTAPRLYSLGKQGAEIMKVPYKTWDTTSLLRLTASNQFWAQIKNVWPDTTWDTTGEYPVVTTGRISFVVIAPRQKPRENFYTILAYNHIGDKRLLVVAASREQAEELACSINPDKARYTWDSLLKNDVVFYRSNGKKLIKDFAKTVDRNEVSSL